MPKNTAFPLGFLARMAELLDDDFPAFLIALGQPPRSGLRVNTLKLTRDEFARISPWPLEVVFWCPDGFLLDRKANAGLHPFYDAGLYYIQEPSTMAVATQLAPQPGERVLDLCGAPGGKATHIAALLAGEGILVANEVNSKRAKVLRRSLARWGARNAVVLNETPPRLAQRWPGAFDRVLVDAPCSGEGMFRKKEEARQYWSNAHVTGCAVRQKEILESAAVLVRAGGLLAYSTCTFAPEENEGIVSRFLAARPDFVLEEPVWFPGLEPGIPAWASWPADSRETTLDDRAQTLVHTIRMWPHRVDGEGHFVALLRREGDDPVLDWHLPEIDDLPDEAMEPLMAFWQSSLAIPLPEGILLRPRDRFTADLFAIPADAPAVDGLRVGRSGWHLGTLRKGRFIPSYSLAMGLTATQAHQVLDEPAGGECVARYLRGEILPVPGPDGWVLICVTGFPLGWGKRSKNVIKNHYPKVFRGP
ncbi:MAG: RsmB/NOP family class I SAM-dependent RNA methyltransferase [Chloroflexota bacterium]|nr:RsmB/NOP family class I SAM-dependent RNA methyltransferase [Chloroflexota bacterium]